MVSISEAKATDRFEIQELLDPREHCADRRNVKGQMSLFTKDTQFIVFMDARSDNSPIEADRREDLASIFEDLNKYEVTTDFMGQSTVVLDGERATGQTYCIVHHVSLSEGKRTLFIASIRDFDAFTKFEGKWLFVKQKLIVDWTGTRPDL